MQQKENDFDCNEKDNDKSEILSFDENDFDIISILEQISTMQENLGIDIENIIDSETDLNNAQARIILTVRNHLRKKLKLGLKTEKARELEKKIAQDIGGFIEKISHKKNASKDANIKNDKGGFLNTESRKNFKRIMKNFVVYEIYKVMNPKRIAGETKEDNYRHNLKIGGQKLAEKYSETKYSPAKIEKLKSQAGVRIKNIGSIGR